MKANLLLALSLCLAVLCLAFINGATHGQTYDGRSLFKDSIPSKQSDVRHEIVQQEVGISTPQTCDDATAFMLPVIDDNPNDALHWDVPFNYFGNYFGALGGYHPGEDWNLVGGSVNADLGKPVYAIANGTVVKISPLGSLGTLVAVKHMGTFRIPSKTSSENGQSYSYPEETVSAVYSIYLHINNLPSSIFVGACVQQGVSIIGHIMNPGGGPHLHFEIRHPNASNSNDFSLVGSPSNWARNADDDPTGYYLNIQEMVNGGVRDPRDFIAANRVTSPYQGYLDNVGCNTIDGWAWDSRQQNTPVSVDVYDGVNKILSAIPADQLRPDLVGLYGNGQHGFSIPTPQLLKDGRHHSVWVKITGPDHNLSFSPKPLTCGYVGYLDVADCNSIRGWAADTTRPNVSLNVGIYDGNTLVTTVPANQLRTDVGSILGDNGLHGFSIPTPSSLKTGSHTVSVRYETTTTNLPNSPKTLSCGSNQPDYLGYLDVADCNYIYGWAADRNRPNIPINVSLYDGSILLTTVLANGSRADVGNVLGDNGLHGFTIPTPASLRDNQPHSISVKFESSSTNLAGSPTSITCGPNYIGYLDVTNCNTISGWAADRNRLNTSISVSLYDGSTLLTTVSAAGSRSDVGSFLGDNGLQGFTIPTPASLKNNQPHSISLRFESSSSSLSGSPTSITCAPPGPNYIGYLDVVNCTTIYGWAADRNRLNTPITVSLYDGSTLLTTVLASGSRSDVGNLLGDDGLHGFTIPTPASLKNSQSHSISVKFESGSSNLSGSPTSITCGPNYIGYLDGANCTTIHGWAADRNRLNTSINVSLYDGSTLLTTVVANGSRADVGNFLGDNGLHGFTIPTPASLRNGQPHTISVKFESGSTNLSGSPMSITCVPSYIGYLDGAACTSIHGWAADRNRLNTPINVSLYDGSTLLTTVVANGSRPDVGSFLGDNGLHGFTIPTPNSLKNGQPHSVHVKFESTTTELNNSPRSITCVNNPIINSIFRGNPPRKETDQNVVINRGAFQPNLTVSLFFLQAVQRLSGSQIQNLNCNSFTLIGPSAGCYLQE